MDKDLKNDIKDILEDAINPLIVEFKAAHNAHGKEIERLTKQSLEHYENSKSIDKNRQKQFDAWQLNNAEKQEKTGVRIGNVEQLITRLDEHIKSNTKSIENITENFKNIQDRKDFHLSQWLVAAGLFLLIFFEFMPFNRGG